MTAVTVKSGLIMIGAVLACTAPFVHMLFPKKSIEIVTLEAGYDNGEISETSYVERLEKAKEEQKLFGFSSVRRFWYAIGQPIALFYFSLIFLGFSSRITDNDLKKAARFSGGCMFFISTYYLIWVMWPNQDLPKSLYHLAIALMSMMGAITAVLINRYKSSLTHKIQRLIGFISFEIYNKYIEKKDRDEFIDDSFSVFDEITKNRT